LPKILIFSKKPADGENLATILRSEGYDLAWTDNGPEAIVQALSGGLDTVVMFLTGKGHRELEYLPCLNSIDQGLPVIVVSHHDSLNLQREVRKYRVFYYLPQPVEGDEIRAVLRDAVASSGGKR
jgi:DNA-binding NtrC family response regulator